ncbi:MAG: hypothetical protein IJT59_07465 [Desulfovibrionaceae bacterium]|nr:hypothetical protein [Desulfovibrionaceae bacterium]
MAWFKTKFTPPKELEPREFLLRAGKILGILLVITLGLVWPYSCLWLYLSGDVGVERAVDAQASGQFAIFGSGVSQDFVDYKLKLYGQVKPTVVTLGSSRVMQFRGEFFTQKFLNMGGVAGNIPVLRSTLDAMLKMHKPEAIILGLDFWWFGTKWNPDPFMEEPPTSGSYNYGLESVKKPWEWLFSGKMSLKDLARPILTPLGLGFNDNRYGIMAQQTSDGFGSDGSWYYTAEITGQKRPFDFQFQDTLTQVEYGIKAFYHASADQKLISEAHLDALAEIYCRLMSKGIRTYVFIPPLAPTVFLRMRDMESNYPHLFNLPQALRARGIQVLDCSDPRKLGSSDCEFVDGFHGGEVTYLRILRHLADQWSSLLAYVDLSAVNKAIREWNGHALRYNPMLTPYWEVDFMELNCPKRKPKM